VLNNLKARRDSEEGFTLIELMVVVLIIAILIAIAIPTFLGARTRAQDRAAQSSLRNALTAAKTAYTDVSDYSTAGPGVVGPPATQLTAIEPSLQYVAGTVSSADLTTPVTPSFKVVSVDVSSTASTTDRSGLGGGGVVEVGHLLLDQGRRDRRGSRDVLRQHCRSDLPRYRGDSRRSPGRLLVEYFNTQQSA
jgi:type IV pilus assembly protein PilA